MNFELTILGANAAVPAHGRYMTAQFLNLHQHFFLIDCAEGTQFRLQEYNCRPQRINHIFISHLHGDHVLGLMGLLSSLGLNNRKAALHIFSPPGLKEMVEIQIRITSTYLSYPLHFVETDPERSACLLDTPTFKVMTIPLQHRVAAHGFLFQEKERPRKMIKAQIEKYQIPYQQIPGIKAGADYVTEAGELIENDKLTTAAQPARSYAFCSDTRYTTSILPYIKSVDLLYHEATFLHELKAQAEKTLHSTAFEAADLAQKAKVKQLIIGHFSSRYADLTPLLEEAQAQFPATSLALDGAVFRL